MSTTILSSTVRFTIVAGRGAASGVREYQAIGGSIRAQKPCFAERGIDLSGFHDATINLDVAPRMLEMARPFLTVRQLHWLPGFPAEDFDLCGVAIAIAGTVTPALVYYPRPETKNGVRTAGQQIDDRDPRALYTERSLRRHRFVAFRSVANGRSLSTRYLPGIRGMRPSPPSRG